jgi:hypothetical protein
LEMAGVLQELIAASPVAVALLVMFLLGERAVVRARAYSPSW